jgi:hypothetical protein
MHGQNSELSSSGESAARKDSGALRIAFLDDDVDQAERIAALLQGAGQSWQKCPKTP